MFAISSSTNKLRLELLSTSTGLVSPTAGSPKVTTSPVVVSLRLVSPLGGIFEDWSELIWVSSGICGRGGEAVLEPPRLAEESLGIAEGEE